MKKLLIILSLTANVVLLTIVFGVFGALLVRYKAASNPNKHLWYQIQSYKSKTSQPYTQDQLLCRHAEARLLEVSKNFSHDKFENDTTSALYKESSFNELGENLATRNVWWDLQNPSETLISWLSSPKHRKVLDSSKFTHSCLRCNETHCVQLFAGY